MLSIQAVKPSGGDILTLYAICGLLLLPFFRLPSAALVLLGAFLIALPEFISFGFRVPSGQTAITLIEQVRQIYGKQDYPAILRFCWRESWSLIIPLLIMVFPRTAGLMCWGMASWRSGFLKAPERHRRTLTVGLVVGGIVGGAITASEVWTE